MNSQYDPVIRAEPSLCRAYPRWGGSLCKDSA
jgi:hypothetical protein